LKENALSEITADKSKQIQAKDMSREFTLKVFKHEQRLRENAFKALRRTKEHLIQEEFAVQNEILYDKLFAKFKVEQDTYNQALSLHNLNLDPEV
jgi:hypothetical protein